MPSSRLSLNGNTLAVSNQLNLQMMPRNSLHSSKSNDAIHSHGLATITSNRALQHFNIDEYYVPNDERCHVIGKIHSQTPHLYHQHRNQYYSKTKKYIERNKMPPNNPNEF